jgi:hypothetical protein
MSREKSPGCSEIDFTMENMIMTAAEDIANLVEGKRA